MIKLTRKELQTVVDWLLVQHDSIYEVIVDEVTTKDDREQFKKDERVLRKFLLAAQERGVNIRNSAYSWEDKMKHIGEV